MCWLYPACLPASPLPLLKLGSNAFFKSKCATCTYGWCGAYLLYYYRKKQQLVGIQVGLFLFQPVRRTQVQGSNSSHHNDIFFSLHFRWLVVPAITFSTGCLLQWWRWWLHVTRMKDFLSITLAVCSIGWGEWLIGISYVARASWWCRRIFDMTRRSKRRWNNDKKWNDDSRQGTMSDKTKDAIAMNSMRQGETGWVWTILL
jgi:hypothetical protein